MNDHSATAHLSELKNRVRRCRQIAGRYVASGDTQAIQALAAEIEAELDQVIRRLVPTMH